MTTVDAKITRPIENVQTLVDRIIRRIKVHRTCEGFTDAQMYLVLDEIEPPVVIFGDTHGQLNDLLRFADIVGEPPGTQWLLLGDYIDRCKKGLEVIMLLLCFKIKYPSRVNMLRGNHECQKTNRIYGFYTEMKLKRTTAMWLRFNKLFNELPLCATVSRRQLCMHGGISQHIKDWNSLTELKKPHSIQECDDGIALDLLWADPTNDACEFRFNANRCTSVIFGDTAIKDFCKRLGISMIVRAHEAVQEGHQMMPGNRLCTLFSAPNYCGNDGNCASVMHVSPTFKLGFTTLKPRIETSTVPSELLKKLRSETEAKSPNPQPVRRLLEPPSSPKSAEFTNSNPVTPTKK
ncbi:hypothetical protein PRIPAC_74775 [Pristionchus pacificus]|uniref:Serine/threonine-protein phosphatase n=1 Tax=Pristionchus pacificus TaxID=54126 RepID=A0A2A6B4P6_PRIPA|nr:hypothetical protein PRIPAC_74775 [Pristionchus pacificus]|eukprot:PDM60844.1 Calcineurin-like phosphoesterase [Pristionchus pacificus]